MMVSKCRALALCAAGITFAAHAQDAAPPAKPAILEAETSDVAKLAPMGPHRVLIGGGLRGAGVAGHQRRHGAPRGADPRGAGVELRDRPEQSLLLRRRDDVDSVSIAEHARTCSPSTTIS